jgi:FkbM family methyltransferase
VSVRQYILKMIRKALPRPLIFLVEHFGRLVDPHSVKSYSQEGEDLILRRLFDSCSNGYYVDVGAHHPLRFSNTFAFYKMGWRGINIDPSPKAIRLFDEIRPRDVNLAFGISDKPGVLIYYVFDEPALNTFDSALVQEREKTTRYRVVETMEVPVFRLDEVLSRHIAVGQVIDFMSIDAEGYDFKVIQSNNWTHFRPLYLLVECLDSSLTSLSSQPMHRFLDARGYSLYAKTVNTLFYRDGQRAS